MSKQEHVVIKRSKSKSHGDHHGGAWKVAFADFMIALMALFLVLWIMQVVDQDERRAIVTSLNDTSIFSSSFGNPFDSSSSLAPVDLDSSSSVPSRAESDHIVTSFFNGNGEGPENDSLIPGTFETQEELELLAKVVKEKVKQAHAQNNVSVEITPQGLRIVLQDDYKQNMFQRGKADITPFFEDLLIAIAPLFKQVQNPLMISGHTDATQYRQRFSSRSNWELSTSRANVARQTLVAGGMPDDRVLQVTGMSDRAPINNDDPNASENRRIELFVMTKPTVEMLETLFGQSSDSDLNQAKADAAQNQPVVRQAVTQEQASANVPVEGQTPVQESTPVSAPPSAPVATSVQTQVEIQTTP